MVYHLKCSGRTWSGTETPKKRNQRIDHGGEPANRDHRFTDPRRFVRRRYGGCLSSNRRGLSVGDSTEMCERFYSISVSKQYLSVCPYSGFDSDLGEFYSEGS